MNDLLDYAREHADEILRTLRDMIELEPFRPGKGGSDAQFAAAVEIPVLDGLGRVGEALPATSTSR